MPLCSRMRRALISGITSGTFGSMRKADELSITTAPAFTAIGANFLRNAAAGREQRDIDAVEGVLGQAPRSRSSRRESRRLAGRARARQRFELADREAALVQGGDEFGTDGAGHAGNGNNGIVRSLWSPCCMQAIKKPRTFSGGASVQMMRSFDYARTPPEAPRGLAVLVVVLVVADHGAGLMGEARRRSSTRFWLRNLASTRLNRTPLLRDKLVA